MFDVTGNYHDLFNAVRFEPVCKGRQGAILMDASEMIVRTTTSYSHPSQYIPDMYRELVGSEFNNLMVEVYDNYYRKMGYHTDQALDLVDDSWINIYSFYNSPVYSPRTLMIKNKISGEIQKIQMYHGSCVAFNMQFNREHTHKIILENPKMNCKWLGITARVSKTSAKGLRYAPELRREMCGYKREENLSVNYKWPSLDYTVSESDLMPVV